MADFMKKTFTGDTIEDAITQASVAFGLTIDQLNAIMKHGNFVGRAPAQTEEFIREHVQPVLDQNQEILGLTAEINV